MKGRTLIGSLGVLVVLNLAIKPAWLLVENGWQDRLGNLLYGSYAEWLAFTSLLSPVLDLGLNQFLVNRLAHGAGGSTGVFGQVVRLKVWLSVLYGALLVGVSVFNGGTSAFACLMLGAFQLALAWLMLGRSLLQIEQRFRTDAVFSVSDKLLALVVLLLVPLLLPDLQPDTGLGVFMGTLTVSTVVAALACWVPVVRSDRWGSTRSTDGGTYTYATALRQSLPYAGIYVLFNTIERQEILWVSYYTSTESAGLFAAAYRWYATASMYLWTVLPVFYARFAHQHAEPLAVQARTFRLGQAVVFLPVVVVSGFMAWYGRVVFFQFVNASPEELTVMAQCLGWLGGALALNALCNIYSTYLTATGQTRWVNQGLVLGIVVQILGSAVLAPLYGAVGGAGAFCLGFVAAGGWFAGCILRYRAELTEVRHLAGWLILGGACYAAWGVCHALNLAWWQAGLMVGTLAACCAAYLFWQFKRQGLLGQDVPTP
jgi:O-antigen/teichoic acid export membrane protein